MKFIVEIECDEENFPLNNLDWLILEGGSYNDKIGDDSVENGTQLFTYILKLTESKKNASNCSSTININNSLEKTTIENTSNLVDVIEENVINKLGGKLNLLQHKIFELNEKIDKLENHRVVKSPDVIPVSTPKNFPPPPPPLPIFIAKENVTPQSKSYKTPKKSLSPTSIITIDDLKNVKLKKRTEIFYTSKICPTILNIS